MGRLNQAMKPVNITQTSSAKVALLQAARAAVAAATTVKAAKRRRGCGAESMP